MRVSFYALFILGQHPLLMLVCGMHTFCTYGGGGGAGVENTTS
jgi:hypothetical protein